MRFRIDHFDTGSNSITLYDILILSCFVAHFSTKLVSSKNLQNCRCYLHIFEFKRGNLQHMNFMTFSDITNMYVHKNHQFLFEFMELRQLLDSYSWNSWASQNHSHGIHAPVISIVTAFMAFSDI